MRILVSPSKMTEKKGRARLTILDTEMDAVSSFPFVSPIFRMKEAGADDEIGNGDGMS